MGKLGRVFADRYHAHLLRTPTEARNALLYVINNHRKHACPGSVPGLDPFSSAARFDGWSRPVVLDPAAAAAVPVVAAQSWLLRTGWRRARGRIDPDAAPVSMVSMKPGQASVDDRMGAT
jgi:hypothetical protein